MQQTSIPAAMPSSTGSIGLNLLWFVLVIALIPLALWLLKRSPYGAAMGGVGGRAAAPMRTLGSMPLGAHQRVVTVEVGEGDERRWLVLGVTPQSITTLHTLTPSVAAAALGDGSAQQPLTFQALFKKVRDAKGRDARV